MNIASVLAKVAWLALSAEQAAQPTLAQVSPSWKLTDEPGTCRLERTIDGTSPVHVAFEAKVGSYEYSLDIIGKGLKRYLFGVPDEAEIRVDGKMITKDYAVVFAGEKGAPPNLNMAGLPRKLIDALVAGHTFAIVGERVKIGPLALPTLDKAMAALSRCEAEQLAGWGADPSQFKPGGQPPQVTNAHGLVAQSTLRALPWPTGGGPYPHALLVGEDGKVQRCSALAKPNPQFEQRICAALVGRTIAKPAQDPSGKAVVGIVTYTPGILRHATIPVQ